MIRFEPIPRMIAFCIAAVVTIGNWPLHAAEPIELTARDTLGELTDNLPDAQKCLAAFAWKPSDFRVRIESPPGSDQEDQGYDWLVRFPSPIPSGNAINDNVSMEWYQPRDEKGRVRKSPVVLIIHESGSAMPAGRAIARGLSSRGWHAVLMHLPYYGQRRPGPNRPEVSKLLETMRQGIADVRRARDAVAALPDLDSRHIGLQGTSLGGFVAATAGSLDRSFNSVHIMLAGGDLYDVVQTGKQDTAKVRQKLADIGYTGEKLRDLLSTTEPMRVAHRLDPKSTWMYSALQDDVVPIRNARRLAEAARLEPGHHIQLVGGHYTVAIYLPGIMDHISEQLQRLTDSEK